MCTAWSKVNYARGPVRVDNSVTQQRTLLGSAWTPKDPKFLQRSAPATLAMLPILPIEPYSYFCDILTYCGRLLGSTMSSVTDHLNKVREQRLAREKARIDKLRELNLKKYTKPEEPKTPRVSTSVTLMKNDARKSQFNFPKNNLPDVAKRPITAPSASATNISAKVAPNVSAKSSSYKITDNTKPLKSNVAVKKPEYRPWNYHAKVGNEKAKPMEKRSATIGDNFKRPSMVTKSEHSLNNVSARNIGDSMVTKKPVDVKNESRLPRKSFVPKFEAPKPTNLRPKPQETRKSILPPKPSQSAVNVNTNQQSVFDRLYQPKMRFEKKNVTDSEKIQNDPNFLKKIIKNTGLILNKRHTVFDNRKTETALPRRSISAVHFKRISKNELSNCMHKWSSMGDKLDKVHLSHVNEDAGVKGDKIVSAVKSDRKKVKFQTPIYNFNTPRPEELQSRLQNWLKKRGKSIDSYHHLQCFGIHHLAHAQIKPLNLEATKFEEFDDEDKENKPLESDSDNDSYEDNMNNKEQSDKSQESVTTVVEKADDKNCVGNDFANERWRRRSYMSDCITDLNETQDSIMTPLNTPPATAAYWECRAAGDLPASVQCWEEAIAKGTQATAAYWECRAALEERRGDLPASVQCWEEAIAKGTQATAAYWECRAALEERRGDLPASVQCWEEAIAKGTQATAAYWECRAALEERRGDLPASVQCWEEAIAKGTQATAAYWECRAALEERRGDLPASVQCWEEAIAKGTQRSVVEANLDQLLDKFMQLKISPNSGARRRPDPKLVDVKNVFKSTLIRFAVQQAKLRQSQEPKFTVTPVRRSARLSVHGSARRTARTPLQECTTVRQAGMLLPPHQPLLFVPNDKLCETP
ncbi:hypothetical protein NE865_07525 [Phthorimaea operculella]|nr:hypothetical protein NE865_07525 [Phthorimaea operculella]